MARWLEALNRLWGPDRIHNEDDLRRLFLVRSFLALAVLGALNLATHTIFAEQLNVPAVGLGAMVIALLTISGLVLVRFISPAILGGTVCMSVAALIFFAVAESRQIASLVYLVAPILVVTSVYSTGVALIFTLGCEVGAATFVFNLEHGSSPATVITVGAVLMLSFAVSSLMANSWRAAFAAQRRAESATVEKTRRAVGSAFPANAVLEHGAITHPTPAFCALFGDAVQTGSPLSVLCDPSEFGALRDALDVNIPLDIRKGDRVVEIFSAPVKSGEDSERGLCILAARDVTERARMAEQVATSQRVVALGELAAGVAHEIQNPLTSLVLCVEFLEEGQPAERDDIVEIQRAAERIRQTVNDLIALTNSKGEPPVATLVAEPIESALRLAEATIRATAADIQVHHDDGELAVLAAPVRMSQALAHIIVNAVTAQGEPPTRTPIVNINTQLRGEFVEVRISDNGLGISPDLLQRIFDPFVSTREVGDGAGLGLSLAHNVFTAVDGTLEIEHSGEEGTTVLGRLKALDAFVDGGSGPVVRVAPDVHDAEILVVTHDTNVAEAIGKLLSKHVDSVHVCSFAEAKEKMKTLVFDLVIAEIGGGSDVGNELLRDLPAATCGVAVRGARFSTAVHSFLADWDGLVLNKPVTEGRLFRALNALAHQRQQRLEDN